METYLVHHGIKGQRWGVRRYQNEDGSWTEAGKKHRGLKIAGAVLGGGLVGGLAYAKRSKLQEATKKQLGGTSKGLNNISGNVNSVRSTRKDLASSAAKQQALEEAKNMTDDQLKERIGRLNLENNYVNAISQQQVVNGADTVDRILAVTGTVLGIAATGVGIWASLKKG